MISTKDIQEFLEDVKQRIVINPHNLVMECRDQPVLYSEVGEIQVKAKSLSRRAKDNFEYVCAEIEKEVRLDPESFDLVGKVTEAGIKNAVALDGRCRKAKQEHLQADEDSDALSIQLASIEQRKNMIRDLVSLYNHEYYVNDDMKADMRSALETTEKKIVDMGKSRRRRKG